jgi:hypothetical protein
MVASVRGVRGVADGRVVLPSVLTWLQRLNADS